MAKRWVENDPGRTISVLTFSLQADGKTLYVYMKEGGPSSAALHARPSGRLNQPSYDDMDVDTNGGVRAGNGNFQDGRYGFIDRGNPPRGPRRRF